MSRRDAGPLAVVLALGLVLAPAAGVRPAGAAEEPAVLAEVGHDDLGARGLNSAVALAGRCAFVGSRGSGPIEIVDVVDPAHPRTAGSLPGRPATTARELRAIPDRRLLIVLSYALGRGGANRFDVYRWTDDCARPEPIGAHDFGGQPPHEFYLWRDPGGGQRILLFTAMFKGGAGALQVVDVSNPAAPSLAGTWSAPIGSLHSLSLSPDGRRAYLALWTGGLLVADVSEFTAGAASPQLHLLTPVAGALPAPAGGNVHSAVPVPSRELLLLTDERYPPGCPYGPARLVDAADPAHLREIGTIAAPENDIAVCRGSPFATYTSHNPTIVGDLAFVTWYASGVQVLDLADPAHPRRLAEFRPAASEPGQRDPQLGGTRTMTWSYPIVRDGLIYLADIDEGLYVLRYRGPGQESVSRAGFAEGNSNLTAPVESSPTPSPSSPPGSPTAGPAGPRAGGPGDRG